MCVCVSQVAGGVDFALLRVKLCCLTGFHMMRSEFALYGESPSAVVMPGCKRHQSHRRRYVDVVRDAVTVLAMVLHTDMVIQQDPGSSLIGRNIQPGQPRKVLGGTNLPRLSRTLLPGGRWLFYVPLIRMSEYRPLISPSRTRLRATNSIVVHVDTVVNS